ncbi:Bcr/CflA family drug resistance efflux transporter [Malaciobacter pacificus]|uniref:Drug resistance transporter, Bcr/CflA family n=1 Tax=Malaciobacter pacificus TaxID=1080223 RepID=A0A5C2H9G5_9BACT|nr:multidrug effflux MFS transporter [Malaciobacter pacificus]QEP35620.1 drug resistance transporter, Bcr/CflA family [Malaciobacter pacificus]GGD46210.1 Bcr/CflA family drug resistance efflux transporter [Malaciobacter pacificus]
MKKSAGHIYLIILLAVLSSVAPMGIDTYIPSIPDIASALHVGIEKIELTLSIFLIGFSIGQIFGGPISDRYGRRKSSIAGLLGYSLFSLLIIISSNIYELWAYRFFEAFFGGIVVVNAAAAVRDRFHGEEAAKIFALIGTIRSLAPLIAPALGAFIIHFFSWEAVFIFLTVYSLIIALWVYKDLEESFTYVKQDVIKSFKSVLTHKKAIKAMLTLALGFSGFFIYISKSSFIFIEHFKISTDLFPFFFGFNFLILIAMIRVNIVMLRKYTQLQLIKFAITIQIISGALMIVNYEGSSLIITMALMASYMSMMAFIFGNCMALALEHFSKNAGVASSVVGVLQFGLGALISSIALSFHNNTFLPIGISITVISLVSFFIIRTYK